MKLFYVILFLFVSPFVGAQTISYNDLKDMCDKDEFEVEEMMMKKGYNITRQKSDKMISNDYVNISYGYVPEGAFKYLIQKSAYKNIFENHSINDDVALLTRDKNDYLYFMEIVKKEKFRSVSDSDLDVESEINFIFVNHDYRLELTNILEGDLAGLYLISLSNLTDLRRIVELKENTKNGKLIHPFGKYVGQRKEIITSGNLNDLVHVEISPVPPGGMNGFRAWLANNYQYPSEAIDAMVKGTVTVSFDVDIDGSLQNIKILKDVGYGTGKAFVNLLKRCRPWTPGMIEGKPVKVSYTLPINLNLTGL